MAFKKKCYRQQHEKDTLEEKITHTVDFVATGLDAIQALLSKDYGLSVVKKMAAAEIEVRAPWVKLYINDARIQVDHKGTKYHSYVHEKVPVISLHGFMTKLRDKCINEGLGNEFAEKVCHYLNFLFKTEGYNSASRVSAYELVDALIKGPENVYRSKIAPEEYKQEAFGIGRMAQKFAAEMFGKDVYAKARAKSVLEYTLKCRK